MKFLPRGDAWSCSLQDESARRDVTGARRPAHSGDRVGLFTVGAGGPDYDLSTLRAWIDE
jgi:hypothetical protein